MATKDRPGIFAEGYFTEGIGAPGFGSGLSPNVGGSGSSGSSKIVKENITDVKKDMKIAWNRFMNLFVGTKNKDYGTPTMWHNTKGKPLVSQFNKIKDEDTKKYANKLYYDYLRADGVIPGKFEYKPYLKVANTVDTTKLYQPVKVNPYKKFNLKTQDDKVKKNTQKVVDTNVTLSKDPVDKGGPALYERLFNNPKVRSTFIDKTGSGI
jgi:hypothetical protein